MAAHGELSSSHFFKTFLQVGWFVGLLDSSLVGTFTLGITAIFGSEAFFFSFVCERVCTHSGRAVDCVCFSYEGVNVASSVGIQSVLTNKSALSL